jgi:metal-responsive CopG/Arc/MetJ family transcriptional regulator
MSVRRKNPQASGKSKRLRSVYLDDATVAAIDEWRERQEGEPSRSDALRRMARRVLRADAATTEVRP